MAFQLELWLLLWAKAGGAGRARRSRARRRGTAGRAGAEPGRPADRDIVVDLIGLVWCMYISVRAGGWIDICQGKHAVLQSNTQPTPIAKGSIRSRQSRHVGSSDRYESSPGVDSNTREAVVPGDKAEGRAPALRRPACHRGLVMSLPVLVVVRPLPLAAAAPSSASSSSVAPTPVPPSSSSSSSASARSSRSDSELRSASAS